MANPPGTHHQQGNHTSSFSSFNGVNNNGHSNSVSENSTSTLKHNPGISLDWSPDEQAILEDGLKQYAGEPSISRYTKIAVQLQNKTIRDVALRCRWMTKKEHSKRRKEDNLARRSKDKKERFIDPSVTPSNFMARPTAHPYDSTSMIPTDYDDGLPCKVISGVAGELLEQNAKALNLISANLSTMKLQENIALLSQTRYNILKIMDEMKEMPELMKQMPPLPVKINEELASTILLRPNIPMK